MNESVTSISKDCASLNENGMNHPFLFSLVFFTYAEPQRNAPPPCGMGMKLLIFAIDFLNSGRSMRAYILGDTSPPTMLLMTTFVGLVGISQLPCSVPLCLCCRCP